MTPTNANGVALDLESFGDEDAPLVLLAGGTTMLSWPDPLCERLAARGRRVVRHDLRDSGESTTARAAQVWHPRVADPSGHIRPLSWLFGV